MNGPFLLISIGYHLFICVCAGNARFVSVTYRLFKMVTTTRGACHVTYKGGILGSPEKLKFDHAVTFLVRNGEIVKGADCVISSWGNS